MQVYVRPRRVAGNKHVLVRDPSSWLPVPREGKWVTMDEYWARRLRDEDVVEVEPPEQVEDAPVPVSHDRADADPAAVEAAQERATTDRTEIAGPVPAEYAERHGLSPDPEPAIPETEEPTAAKRRGR